MNEPDNKSYIIPVDKGVLGFPAGEQSGSNFRLLEFAEFLRLLDCEPGSTPMPEDYIPVGMYDSRMVFATAYDSSGEIPDIQWVGLRQFFGLVDDELFGLLGRAAHLVHWHRGSRYCGCCGSPTNWHNSELAKRCTRCDSTLYPRISPAVITAITRSTMEKAGSEKSGIQVLLAKHAGRKSANYGLIAGFIEPGETAEQAVIREIAEETGLQVKNIRYVKSQAWPFPENLMLGFTAEYHTGELTIQESEISHADWFSQNDLPPLPSGMSLSRFLTGYVLGINWDSER